MGGSEGGRVLAVANSGASYPASLMNSPSNEAKPSKEPTGRSPCPSRPHVTTSPWRRRVRPSLPPTGRADGVQGWHHPEGAQPAPCGMRRVQGQDRISSRGGGPGKSSGGRQGSRNAMREGLRIPSATTPRTAVGPHSRRTTHGASHTHIQTKAVHTPSTHST